MWLYVAWLPYGSYAMHGAESSEIGGYSCVVSGVTG